MSRSKWQATLDFANWTKAVTISFHSLLIRTMIENVLTSRYPIISGTRHFSAMLHAETPASFFLLIINHSPNKAPNQCPLEYSVDSRPFRRRHCILQFVARRVGGILSSKGRGVQGGLETGTPASPSFLDRSVDKSNVRHD
ncbi:hypothetical protein BDBG_09165 [Blastomyces gilchristii SLH14081]|uniref:Uncharacterized protein n=1 Tax=Blastomyces gilchristii (strain SLH14081) TaxID=559298 RepID=A0A179V185_BLAGS|nr:uncharacterized protein BDBG_09165 [Blastomyces gilchristii SLH14081]OAT14075.1 hypothetical protein BDBG_09165 [Blastomyces gilchristii SLH14081]